MKTTISLIDLNEMHPNDPRWDIIQDLVVPGWSAQDLFQRLRKEGSGIMGLYELSLVYLDGVAVAWGLRLRKNRLLGRTYLWLYTHPDYRNRGIQKNVIIPYWNKLGEEFHVQADSVDQKETFKYLLKKIEW